ncbi:unnamed protein product [Penicillium salamii]|uniref:ABC transporter n=1 Tax=Penicillium salamii TaxID=1612424 RepID=A0A9W4IV79_9EURO|nr:unnamed protein product [Penicillium salamii]CAG8046790.1 unnamed protein product [Penicillium salamii]CAG8067447.1 unnamed protein product [Penicillium salamii]CAG8118527.1 unnamed protein product [Penicillium salamii]CAG8128268.1 unnamed protein product [Penicillium salamii]
MASHEGKVIAITGAASGMGLAAAQLLASRGASISMADLNEEALKTAIDTLPGGHERHIAIRVDVRNETSVDSWIEKTVQRFGKLDGAVNMAGVLGPSVPTTELTKEQLEFVFSVNVFGVFNCLRAQLRVMKSGSIVSAASTFGQITMPNSSAYCSSKAAVIAFSKSTAKENKDVRINCVAPGTVYTPMSAHNDPKRVESGILANAQRRLGSAEEVAKVIAFLLSEESTFVTGAVYNVDGGWDSHNAWISPCALPYLACIPAIVALLIAASHLLEQFPHWRPKWTIPFISEQHDLLELPLDRPAQSLGWTTSLLIFSAIGLTADLIQLVPPAVNWFDVIIVFSWTVASILIAVKRPRACSIVFLAFYVLLLAVELSLAASSEASLDFKVVARYIAAAASAAASTAILLMPFRETSLPSVDISTVGQQPSSDFRTPEDNLRLWQFLTVSWMAPLISTGCNRQLNEDDVWLLGFDFQHSRLHEKFRRLRGSVLGRLLRANGIDVFIISTISIVQLLCDFSTPVLLQQLLQAMKDPLRPKRVALTYALISFALRLIAAQAQVLLLWYGRRSYERSRGEMIMMVYEKALSRKNILGVMIQENPEEPENETSGLDNGVSPELDEPPAKPTDSLWRRIISQRNRTKIPPPKKAKEAASLGKIFNLLRGDVYEVAQRFWEVDSLINQPLGLIIATILVWTLFGPSCFLGILAVLVAQVVNALITRVLLRWERVRRAATDSRLQITSQFVEAIRHLRWYGWQNHWLQQVMEARQHELNIRIVTSLWSIMIRFVNAFASGAFPVVALYAYTFLAGHELRIDIIFPALQLFSMLESRLRDIPGLITSLINASIALGRIEDFMSEPDKKIVPSELTESDTTLSIESGSFAWPGKVTPVLVDINVNITRGLTVVTGKVGAGKTAFLQALLGELDTVGGSIHIPNEMVGYCAQTPWLQSMSIRDNILFSAPYHDKRYKQTLEACALLPDLSQFKHGDLSFVGENGIGLSGGQKARVALARAVYSASRVLLLDDPLSALDHNTAESVVRKCLLGPLMKDRTAVLVTHRTALVRQFADQIIDISEKHAVVYDKRGVALDQSDTPSTFMDYEDEHEAQTTPEEEAAAVPAKFIEQEHRAEGGVKARVYWSYIKAGKYRWWLALVLILTIYRLMAVGQSWFLKGWGEAYEQTTAMKASSQNLTSQQGYTWAVPSSLDAWFTPRSPMDQLPSPREDVRPWLWTFFAIISLQAATLLVAQLLMLVIVYCAGQSLFRQVLVRVSHSTFRYLDTIPLGRLMNRLTSDIGVVDGNISEQFQAIAFQAITWISSVLVIATATPMFLLFSLALTVAFVMVFRRFLPTSQSLRRLEMVSLSPLLSNFGELLHGLTTVRAFHAESRFQSRVISVVDKFQGMDHFYWSLQSWLMYRFESLSAFSTFCLTALALYTNTTPGLVAFVLIAANNFVESTHALCKQYGQLQMDFVSVERVDELLHIEEEAPGSISPPAAWPTYGSDIVFDDVTLRYAPHLDPSLMGVSLRIPGGSTIAVTGRTGSGKSTLAMSLLSVIKPESGRILIDGIDIAEVSTQALRTRVTFVAQDPVLFPGSIRLNLDPTEEYSDEQCTEVLERLCSRDGWDLETHIEAGGRNLSQGQRQLIALTRAVLRRSAIVILDEATASVDQETSLEIQQIIREELQQSTVLTIAHRIEAVKDADYFVVLDQGKVSREGHVRDL